MSVKVAMISLGCPKNQVEAERMLAMLADDGCELVGDPAQAQVAVVNTCGFIDAAKQEAGAACARRARAAALRIYL